MRTDWFNDLLAAGAREARIFALNIALFLDMIALEIKDKQTQRIEGCDFDVRLVRWTQVDVDAELATLVGELGISVENKQLVPEVVRGGIEIKAVLPGRSLHRNDTVPWPCISLPFALWDGNTLDKNGNLVYTMTTHGWLRRIFEPEWMPLSAEPIILVFMLETWDEHGNPRPYASVVFKDFAKLKARLVSYGRENGLDLEDWDSIPTGTAVKHFHCGKLMFSANLWLVPLDILLDLADITIIGDTPAFWDNGICTVSMQEKRYHNLCKNAKSFIAYNDLRVEGDIGAVLPNHPVFELLQLQGMTVKN